MFIILGNITPTAGTPVDLFQNFPNLRNKVTHVNSVYFQVGESNIQDAYIGIKGMVVASDINVIAVLRPPTANSLSEVTMEITNSPNPYVLNDFRIDVANTGDLVRVTAQVF